MLGLYFERYNLLYIESVTRHKTIHSKFLRCPTFYDDHFLSSRKLVRYDLQNQAPSSGLELVHECGVQSLYGESFIVLVYGECILF